MPESAVGVVMTGWLKNRKRIVDCQQNIPDAACAFPDPMTTRLTSTFSEAVCTLTLVPPEGKPPTLDHAVMDAFERELAGLEGRAGELRAVVLRSASPRFFCAGANLRVMETIDSDSIGPWVRRGHALLNRLEALPVPVVARVEGYALGGGLELAMACDLILASSAARFGQTEAKLGFVTGWGGSYRLVRRVGLARAKELVFSGRIVDPAEAVRLGLAEWEGTPAELAVRLGEFLAGVAGNSRVAVAAMKRILESCPRTRLEENAAIEVEESRRVLSEGDAGERLQAFLRRKERPASRA
jgi:enoyl-CoA hydratase